MQRFYLLSALALALPLLAACPDTKLPMPPPRIPTPKVDTAPANSRVAPPAVGGAPAGAPA